MAWGTEMRNLSNEISDQHKERTKYVQGIEYEVGKLRSSTRSLLNDIIKENKARAKGVEELQSATQNFLAKFRKEFNEETTAAGEARAKHLALSKTEIAKLLDGFQKEREEAASAWKDLLEKVSMPKEKKKEKPKAKPPKETPAMTTEEEKEEFLGRTEKEIKILSEIRDHPEGVTLPEIAYKMGVAFVTITRDAKKLIEDGLIKKEENQYFLS